MILLAREHGLALVAGATHPFADWRAQEIYPDPRYEQIVEDLQLVARANLIFGLHVHVGMEDRETAIQRDEFDALFSAAYPGALDQLSFLAGHEDGAEMLSRKVFDKFPRTNIPDSFASWSEFESFVDLLIKTNCLDNAKKIWWDIRPHPFFSTIEVPRLRYSACAWTRRWRLRR